MALENGFECIEHIERGVTFPLGFKAAAVRGGLKSRNRDIAIIVAEHQCPVAGVFTQNVVRAPSVDFSSSIIKKGVAQAIFVNAGNANACVGPKGIQDNLACATLTADSFKVAPEHVVVASTGVIGRLMPMDKVEMALSRAGSQSGLGQEIDGFVAEAIMTTDLIPKQIAVECRSPHWVGVIRFGGVAKGSGMIAPNMATTLSFVTTDAQIDSGLLQKALSSGIQTTFNRITVDGDTSTNDMSILLASGASGVSVDKVSFDHFCKGLNHVLNHLAKEVARDGEGATKLVAVHVRGAASEKDAVQVGKTIAESSLVKTALFGCDPNWGRIIAAAGRSGVTFNPDEASAWIGDVLVFSKGVGGKFDADAAHEYLKGKEVTLTVHLGSGETEATVWTCDYSYDYVKINAEYHT